MATQSQSYSLAKNQLVKWTLTAVENEKLKIYRAIAEFDGFQFPSIIWAGFSPNVQKMPMVVEQCYAVRKADGPETMRLMVHCS